MTDTEAKKRKTGLWILLGLLVIVVLFIRLRLLGIPFERDEGDYAVNAALLMDGYTFSSPLLMKRFPLIYYIYMFFYSLFGRSDEGVHLGLLLVNLATAYGVFLLGDRLLKRRAAILAAIFFLLLSLSPDVNGLAANREHFQIFFLVYGALFLLKAAGRKRYRNYALAGLMMGLSFAVKQNALFFMAWGGLWILAEGFYFQRRKWQAVLAAASIYSIAALLPFFLILMIYTYAGVFDDFVAKTFYSNIQYLTNLSYWEGVLNFFKGFTPIFYAYTFFFLLAILPFFRWRKEKKELRSKLFLFSFAFFSLLSIVPGWHFYAHYFILILPAVALPAAGGMQELIGFSEGKRPSIQRAVSLLPVLFVLQPLLAESFYFFKADATEASRITYEYNPFPEAKVIGQYIKRITHDTSSIMVLGSEPELYFYAERRPAISAYYMYFLTDGSKRARAQQELLIKEAEEDVPELIVFVNVASSWLINDKTDPLIFNWLESFAKEHGYRMTGVVDLFIDKSKYVFGEASESYKPRSNGYITLFKKEGAK